MTEIYILSGLGVDERVFRNVDFSGFKITFIDWIIPEKDETIEHYARRLSSKIEVDKPTLIGLSFGGIMAIEIGKQIQTEKIILISSAKTRKEIPFYMRLIGRLNLHKAIPSHFFKKTNAIVNWFFGLENKKERQLLKSILKETDPFLLEWSIDKILTWTNKQLLQNTIHIHGTGDRLLPMRYLSCDIKIQGGGHFLTFNRAPELSKILREIISQEKK